jgi:photosystem II stability/assembly factor-like uncharacterized protein
MLTATQPAPTPTLAPPTATPLPTWPDRWEPTEGPSGGLITAIVVDPNNPTTLYAAGAGGAVFKSRDGGEKWWTPGERLAPPSCLFVSLVVEAGETDTIYAANACTGVSKSSDGGDTWSRANDGLEQGVSTLIQSIHAPGLMLAASSTGKVYRSGDGTQSWEPISDGLPDQAIHIHSLDASGPEMYWATTTDGLDDVLYRFDAGHWTAVSLDQPADQKITHVLVDTDDPGIVYVSLEGTNQADSDTLYVLRSTDGGFNWEQVEQPDAPLANRLRQIAVDPQNDAVRYMPQPGGGIVKSEDGGRTWRPVNNGLNNTHIALVAPHPTDPATLYAVPADGGSMFKSTNYGDNWTQLENNDLNYKVGNLVVDLNHPDTIYQLTSNARALRSDDGGATWSATWPDLRFSSISALATTPFTPTVLYANKSGLGLFRSDDGGESWRLLSEAEIDTTYALAVHPDNPDFILSGDAKAANMHRSKDGGDTWDIALQVPDASRVTSVAFDPRVTPFFGRGKEPADPTRLYAASVGSRGTLWFSNDAGDSWQTLDDDLSFADVRVLTVPLHRPGTAYAAVWGGGNWRTNDGGQSWQRLPGDPATSAAAIAVDPGNHNIVYIADGGVPHLYRSTDDGHTWELLFDAGPDYEQLTALALAPSDPTILYVSAQRSGDDPDGGAVFRVETNLPLDENAVEINNNLPGVPVSLAVHRRDPRRIFAALHNGGVWKTVDDGASWRQVKSGLPEIGFSHIAIDPIFPETLFLTGSDLPLADSPDKVYGIWKSSDDGNTWTKIGGRTFGRASGPIRAIAFHPDDQQVMYAAGEGGVYVSPDRGETWTVINGRVPFTPMKAVSTDGQTLYAGSAGAGVFAGTIHPLIHTADWMPKSHLSIPSANIQLVLHPADPLTLYASAFPGGVYKTTDGGATWREHNLGLPSLAVADPPRQGHYALAIAPSAPEVLYAGLYGHGVYRSDDGAATWWPVYGEEETLRDAQVEALLIHPDDDDIVYIATTEGIWRTDDGGQSWAQFGEGLPAGGDARTLALEADGQLYAGTRGYGVYSRDTSRQAADDAWTQLPELDDDVDTSRQQVSLLIHPHDSNTLYAGSSRSGIYKTTDGGLTWREYNVGLGNESVLSLALYPGDDDAPRPDILYTGSTDGIARSVDGGATWHPRSADWPPQQRVASIAFDPTDPNIVYACAKNDAEPEQAGGTIKKSTDGGASWFEITTGLDTAQTFYQILVDRLDPNVVYLATGQDGVYISRDGGATWSSWNEGLWNRVAGGSGGTATRVLQLSADGRLLYFGTDGSGVWRRPAAGAQTK